MYSNVQEQNITPEHRSSLSKQALSILGAGALVMGASLIPTQSAEASRPAVVATIYGPQKCGDTIGVDVTNNSRNVVTVSVERTTLSRITRSDTISVDPGTTDVNDFGSRRVRDVRVRMGEKVIARLEKLKDLCATESDRRKR